jgi:hypothetical protein
MEWEPRNPLRLAVANAGITTLQTLMETDFNDVTKSGVFILENLSGYGANVRLYGDVRVYWDWKGVTTRTSAVCSVSSFLRSFKCPSGSKNVRSGSSQSCWIWRCLLLL